MILSSSACAEEQWSFTLSPYVWLAVFEGDVVTIRCLPPVSVDISLSDAADDPETSFMLISEANSSATL